MDEGEEEWAFPEVGEILTLDYAEVREPRVVQLVKDQGAARIYTAMGSDDIPILLVLDEHGMVHEILSHDPVPVVPPALNWKEKLYIRLMGWLS